MQMPCFKIENLVLKMMVPVSTVLLASMVIWSRFPGGDDLSIRTATYLMLVLSITVGISVYNLVTRPIKKLIDNTDLIGKGVYPPRSHVVNRRDEMGALALAIYNMGEKIRQKQAELNRQKDIYQDLFDQVPCSITVQNKAFKLIEFNKQFSKTFHPDYGDYCYKAYKNLDKKCQNCPVERTFADGRSHFSEESGINKDGTVSHWFAKTAPLRNHRGEIVAAMEMTIDISRRKRLEEIVKDSERKYQAIFESIPNPVFIVETRTFKILACNDSATRVYGYKRDELEEERFSLLFPDRDRFETFEKNIKKPFHERLVNHKKDRAHLCVNIWVRPTTFTGRDVYLITVVDVTSSVETELQLIQAGKMATLGEMATGVAHELNQPLSVIKTASSFINKKIHRQEPIEQTVLASLAKEMEAHVDRASKTITHMRLFGRKSSLSKEDTDLNDVIRRAFDIFSQQLKLRQITVQWDLAEDLPPIYADPVKIEQVVINLLINARDAIVTRQKSLSRDREDDRRICLTTGCENNRVVARICDTGTGIPRAEINKVFDPFFTTKKVGEGTGLGLSISYGIIKECRGNITVKNNKGPGVTFTISFNISREGSDDKPR